jgi:preprotein translocase subunit SecG
MDGPTAIVVIVAMLCATLIAVVLISKEDKR